MDLTRDEAAEIFYALEDRQRALWDLAQHVPTGVKPSITERLLMLADLQEKVCQPWTISFREEIED